MPIAMPCNRFLSSRARVILLAGGGTTWRQMGITLFALLSHPEQLEAVKANPALIPAAVDESLRWNPTNPIFSRLVAQDAELCGVNLPAGAALEICVGAANRDPARWENPDVFDLHRPFQQHLGTGIGPHMCLGRSVAAIEMPMAIEVLLKEFPLIRFDPDAPAPYLTGGLEQRGVSGLRVRLD
jgi:cytochrome P450